MALLKGGFVLLVLVGAALSLAWLARGARRRWAVLGALLLGRGDQLGGARIDLRFATFVVSVVSLLLILMLFPEPLLVLAPGQLAFAALLALPLLAGLLALGADGLARVLPLAAEEEQDEAAEAVLDARELLEDAQEDILELREQVTDPGRVAALEALSEAVVEYEKALEQSGGHPRLDRADLQERIGGVLTLARSCLVTEGHEAARTLGVRFDATPEEVQAVYEAVRRVYEGPHALPGVDPGKGGELQQAFHRIRAA